MPNFFKTGLSKAEILQFFDFPNGCRCHLLFLKSPIFLPNGVQKIKTHEHVKFWQNGSIGSNDIKIFQSGGCRHLGLSKSQNFIG